MEGKVLELFLTDLLSKGFSEAQAGYIGWIIRELADNSLTHAKGPCLRHCFADAPSDELDADSEDTSILKYIWTDSLSIGGNLTPKKYVVSQSFDDHSMVMKLGVLQTLPIGQREHEAVTTICNQ